MGKASRRKNERRSWLDTPAYVPVRGAMTPDVALKDCPAMVGFPTRRDVIAAIDREIKRCG